MTTGEGTRTDRALEPWYVAQAVAGLVWLAGGIFLLPTYLGSLGVAPADIGLIMSMMGVGALISPAVGSFADRQLAHRGVQHVGLVAFVAGAAGMALAEQTVTFALAALLIGIGQGSVLTINSTLLQGAGLPPKVLSTKFAALQAVMVVGQAIGLLLISLGTSAELPFPTMYWALAGIALVALLITAGTNQPAVERLHGAMLDQATGSGPDAGPASEDEAETSDQGRGLQALLASALGIFLLTVLLTQSGLLALEAQYPLYMDDVFGIPPSTTAAALSGMSLLSLLMFAPVGRLLGARGPLPVWLIMLIARIVGAGGLLALTLAGDSVAAALPLLMYLILMLSYPFLNTGGPAMATRVADTSPGTASGAFYGTLAVVSIVGPSLGGWVAGTYGFEYLPWVTLGGAAVALVIVAVGLAPRMARRT